MSVCDQIIQYRFLFNEYIIQSFSSFYYLNKVPDFTLQTDIGNQAFTCFRINSG